MAYVDLDELPALESGLLSSARRPALAWFRRRDHLGDPARPLADSVRELVGERTGRIPRGPIGLLTHLRCFGHNFNPVSFYWCFGHDSGTVEAVVAHVTNTPWGESHSYVLDASDDRAERTPTRSSIGAARRPSRSAIRRSAIATEHRPAPPRTSAARRPAHSSVERGRRSSALARGSFEKTLHVSPLMGMDQTYDLSVTEPGERISVHITSSAADGRRVFDATLSLARRELTRRTLAGMLARYPFQTVAILARIYGHAARLRLRGATYHPHPRSEKVTA
jgi:hypothetical protein